MIQTKLTIIIPCKNEGMGIIDCLKWIELQSERHPVIIADSTDRSFDKLILKKWCEHKEWITIIDGGLPAVARNAGAAASDSQYMLFLDADIMLMDRNTISAAIVSLQGVDLVTCTMRDSNNRWDWLWWAFEILQRLISYKEPFALGGFQMWRREAFAAAGGFDERMKVGEDWMLSRCVTPHRFRILPRLIYTSGRRFTNWGVMRMIRLMIGGWINRNNPQWFYNSHNYWK